MQSVVDRLRAEGRLPSLEKIDQVLRKYRAEYQAQVHKARNQK
jgi:collagenase-like PrtC family protease